MNASSVIAHRGGAAEAVENSLEAFSHAIAVGADWIEFDVQLSKDCVPIVVHDATTDRFWKGCSRNFSDLNFNQIKKLITKEHLALTIPSLDEALALTAGKIGIVLDIKGDSTSNYKLFVKEILSVLSQYEESLQDMCILSSFEPAILEEIRLQAPNKKICLIIEDEVFLRYADALKPEFLSIHIDLVTKSFVDNAHERGIKVWAWTVNRKNRIKECLNMGVNAIITDWPRMMRSLIQSLET